MNVDGYRFKYKSFWENFTFLKSINKGRTTIKRVPRQAQLKTLPSPLPFVVTSFLEEIQSSSDHVDTARVQMLKQLEKLLKMIPISMNFILYYIIGSPKIDDKIICS